MTNSSKNYQHGFSFATSGYTHISQPGLSEKQVREISERKQEPDWMLAKRLQGLAEFNRRPMPNFGSDLSEIDFASIRYYLQPTEKAAKSWADVPDDVKTTFDRLGIPQAERSVLAGVKAQYDSEVVYGSLQNAWAKDGVIFLSMDEALKQHPDLVKEHFGKVIAYGDNKFAA